MFRSDDTRLDRLDMVAFVGAFVVGTISYVSLHFLIRLDPLIVATTIISVMITYALLVFNVPRLRVRMDQAGDNAYYLGLLFTLVSMAGALYEFGSVVESGSGQMAGPTGARQIIANFGIALASTIVGIFLRVVLHQMRIDPAEIEAMTRIELSEASKRVQASLDIVTNDLGRFHDEVRQRSSDVVVMLTEEGKKSVSSINQSLEHSTKEMIVSISNVQKEALNQIQELTHLISTTASEAIGAIERLRTVEPPPLTLSRRLDKVTKVLESMGSQTERIVSHLQSTADSASNTLGEIAKASNTLNQVTQQMKGSQEEAAQMIAVSVEKVSAALDSVARRLEHEQTLVAQLQEQSRRSVEESARAQTAALEVLTRLTELSRALTTALRAAKER